MVTILKYKLDDVKEELVNIPHAIHWANVGVVNSFLLKSEEINQTHLQPLAVI